MDNSLFSHYSKNIEKYSSEIFQINKRLRKLILLRVSFFILVLLTFYFTGKFYHWGIASVILVAGLLVFGYLIKYNQKVKYQKHFFEDLKQQNEKELLYVKEDKIDQFKSGRNYLKDLSNHSFIHDLDIVGKGSVFQMINRTLTYYGERKLVGKFSQIDLNASSISDKQEQAEELSSKTNFLQQVLAHLKQLGEIKAFDYSKLKTQIINKSTILKVLVVIVPIYSIALSIATYFVPLTFILFLLGILIPLSITGKYLKNTNDWSKYLTELKERLNTYSFVIELIEKEDFNTPENKRFQNIFKTKDGDLTSEVLLELNRLLGQLENRNNVAVGIVLNAYLLWDIKYLLKLEQWREDYQEYLQRWEENIFELEALSSLAIFNFNHPSYVHPKTNTEKVLVANEVGHPLIPAQKRITNNVDFEKHPYFILLTGANMAGKSTFLRTIGVNMLLASLGVKVCAKSFVYKPINMFTSMRTVDDLSKSESYFFAELKRLNQLVDKLEKGEELFIILDEILKGTNSKDKEEGSKKFIEKLLKYKCSGIFATHDLSLCTLEDEYPYEIKNKSFEIEFKNEDLFFDYKLKDGFCQNMNASFLMKKMGIVD